MTSSAARLYVLDHGFDDVESNHKIAVRYVKAFLRHRCCEEAVELTPRGDPLRSVRLMFFAEALDSAIDAGMSLPLSPLTAIVQRALSAWAAWEKLN